mgnify:FL=1|tara:strand:- start:2076 stop:2531 length:456 start_codon:yes stop_codon:yes gene_type:complete
MLDKLKEIIIHHEGKRSLVYDDATSISLTKGSTLKGYATIGVGRDISGFGLSEDEIHYLLDNDIKRCIEEIERQNFSWWENLNEVRKICIISQVFNMGLTRFLNFKNMIKALERKDYPRASIEMRDSLWYRQNTNRVEQLAVWMDCGHFPQ